jgi:signal recognition particle receptor subunit alpha
VVGAFGGEAEEEQGEQKPRTEETVFPALSTLSDFWLIVKPSLLSLSSESPAKRRTKTKVQRKWGDEAPTETDMASLDFSSDKYDSSGGGVGSHDLQGLVDESSLGTRTRDGLYEVKDWEFTNNEEADKLIASALKPVSGKTATSGSLGALGSIFARLTGSKVLTEHDLKPVLEGMKQHLMKKNVAREIADKVCEGVGESLVGKKVGGFQSGFLRNT